MMVVSARALTPKVVRLDPKQIEGGELWMMKSSVVARPPEPSSWNLLVDSKPNKSWVGKWVFLRDYLNLTGSVSCDSLGQAPIIPFNSSSLFFACAFLGGRRLKNVLDLKLLESPCQHSVPIHLKLVPDFAPPSGVCSGLVPCFVRKYFILGFKSFLQCITFVTNKTCIARQPSILCERDHNCGSWQSGHTVPCGT